MKEELIYLASPYTDETEIVTLERYNRALYAVATLLRFGIITFSPIVYCHEIAVRFTFGKGIDTWWSLDAVFMERCQRLLVLQLDGWELSKGVRLEVDQFKLRGINPGYVTIEELQTMRETGHFRRFRRTPKV